MFILGPVGWFCLHKMGKKGRKQEDSFCGKTKRYGISPKYLLHFSCLQFVTLNCETSAQKMVG